MVKCEKSKWFFDRIYIKFALSNELWWVDVEGKETRQYQLFFLGFYKKPEGYGKIMVLNILGLSLKVGF